MSEHTDRKTWRRKLGGATGAGKRWAHIDPETEPNTDTGGVLSPDRLGIRDRYRRRGRFFPSVQHPTSDEGGDAK